MNNISKQKQQQKLIAIIFFVAVALIVINSILFSTRFDLTANKVFSISKTTQEIVQGSEDTIYIDYYISPKLKTATEQPQQMIDLLQEYQARSKGHVVFTEKNTDDAGIAQDAQSNQLQQQQIQVVEKNQATYAVVYSGIVIQYQDKKKVIPFFLEASAIEYQLTSKIQELLTDDERVVGLLVLDEAYKDQNSLAGIRQVFKGEYELKEISLDTQIDDSVDALIIVGAKDITNDTAYYIDQFIMNGKGVYFAADTVRVDLQQGLSAQGQYTLLHKMIEHYGIKVENTIVVDEYNKLIPLNTGQGFQSLQQYPMWITIPGENVSKDSPITTRFAGLDLYWTSPLTVLKDKENFTTLVSSSDKSWLVTSVGASQSVTDPETGEPIPKSYVLYPDPSGFISSKSPENAGPHNLTSSFLGPLSSAVEEGIIQKPEDVKAADYKKKSELSRFVVTGSSYFMTGLSRVTQASYNLVFVSNVANWLSSDEKLLQIKSRAIRDYRLNKIGDPVKKDALILVVQAWNMVIIPLIIIVIAIVVFLLRRKQMVRKYK